MALKWYFIKYPLKSDFFNYVIYFKYTYIIIIRYLLLQIILYESLYN